MSQLNTSAIEGSKIKQVLTLQDPEICPRAGLVSWTCDHYSTHAGLMLRRGPQT